MRDFWIVANQVWILFALMGVGYVARVTKLVNQSAVKGFVSLLFYVVTPALTIDVFQRTYDPAMLKGLGLAFSLAFLSVLASTFIVKGLVRHREDDTQVVLRASAVFSNAGFMGIPLEQAMLGDEGVFYGMAYIVVFHLFVWSWGVKTMSKFGKTGEDAHARFRRHLKMFVNPGTVGIAIGLPLFFLSAKLPSVIETPIHLIGGLNTPLAMIVIGFYLVGVNPFAALKQPSACAAIVLRLLAVPLGVIGALWLLRGQIGQTAALAVVIPSSAPVAAMVTMFAAQFARDVKTSVSVVSATTLLSAVTMPAVIAIAIAILT